MKTIVKYLLLVAISILSSGVYAQSFNGGIHAGVVASQLSGDELAGFNQAGVFAGAYVSLYFTPKSSVQLEMDFIQKGSRQNPKESNGFYSYISRFNYIEMPVLYKLDVAKWLTLEIGFAAAYLVTSSEEENGQQGISYLPFKKYEISLLGGAYYNISKHFMVNIRYENTFPFLPIRQHSSQATYLLNKGQYNSLIVLSLQYQFNKILKAKEKKSEN